MATGANTAPLGRLHPVLAARVGSEGSTPPSNTPLGSKQALNNPELRAHLEAAKRAASALFSGKKHVVLMEHVLMLLVKTVFHFINVVDGSLN